MKKLNNCIIGGSGFVGTRLINLLDKNKLINLDKKPSFFHPKITSICDIRNKEDILFKNNTNSVILLAAEHRDDVYPNKLYYDVNVDGTKNVLDRMDYYGVKNLIFTSSVAVYGLNKDNPDENHKKDPFNHYGKSKLQAEKLIVKWYKNNPKEKSVYIIRPTVIFGERNRGNVYNLLKQISLGKFIMVGTGNNKKSMAYVGNVSEFIKNCISESKKGLHIFNYTDKPDLTMNELVLLIEKKWILKIPKFKIPFLLGIIFGYAIDAISFLLKIKFSISSIRIKKFCSTTKFDSTKLNSVFNPPYTMQEGLEMTLDFEFKNKKPEDVVFYSE